MLKRSPLRRDTGEARLTVPAHVCGQCGKLYTKTRMGQRVCSPRCALREVGAKKKAEREMDRARRIALMTHGDWEKAVEKEFNTFIRLRDAGKPCICCGKPMGENRPGGAVDAGHYLGVGANPHLRFVEMNVNAQRKSCNKPGGATRTAFRLGMVGRYGEAAVAALEADHRPRKYAIADLIEMRDHYRAKVRELKKAAA